MLKLASYIETRLPICSANQLTGFYMIATMTFNELMLLIFLISIILSVGMRMKQIRQISFMCQDEKPLCLLQQRKTFKEVWYNCSAHSSVHLFIIEISSDNHIKRKQPQWMSLQYSCSVTMINTVKKYLCRKIHELNTVIGCSDDS